MYEVKRPTTTHIGRIVETLMKLVEYDRNSSITRAFIPTDLPLGGPLAEGAGDNDYEAETALRSRLTALLLNVADHSGNFRAEVVFPADSEDEMDQLRGIRCVVDEINERNRKRRKIESNLLSAFAGAAKED